MGTVYTEVILKNAGDRVKARDGIIAEKEVRETTIRALVDTGAGTLAITEAVREKLGLAIQGLRRSTLADGTKQVYQVTEPVEIRWKDRYTACPATLLPGAGEVLLGAIPMEDLDLIVDPKRQQVVGAHGDEALYMLK
jgi:clan AA aspartic protease